MTEWRYSRRRLSELETRLEEIDAEQRALDIGGPQSEAVRFANAADRDRYQDLTGEWARLSDERLRCSMTLWRRDRRRSN